MARTQRPAGAVANVARAGGLLRAAASGDQVSALGVPEAELTPRVRAAFTALLEEVGRLRQALADATMRLSEMSTLADTDPLTGVLNRRAFLAELARTQALVQRYGEPSALAFFDVDRMKAINDGHGHAVGDAALVHVARTVGANIRSTDIFARLGGDEFAVILRRAGVDVAQGKIAFLTRLIAETPCAVNGVAVMVGVSGGVVAIDAATPPDALLEQADAAMYAHKKRR